MLVNLYELTNDKNEGMILKERFKDEKFDEKKIYRQTKSVLILTKIFSFDKKLANHFKIWHKFILSENVQEILCIIENVKGEIDILKIRNFTKIIKNKFSKNFQDLLIRIMKKTRPKTEKIFLYKNILFMENFYNNKLLRCCKALQLLMNLRSKRKRFILRRNNKEKKSLSLLANRIGVYFDMWKLKFVKLRKYMRIKYDFYLKFVANFVKYQNNLGRSYS